MALLIGGLALFIIVHLVPTRPSLRAGLVGTLGPGIYRGLFSLVSIAGLVLIVLGYGHLQGLGRGNPQLWAPPVWIKHVVFLLMIPAMILLVAAYVPSRIRSAVGHPMLTALMIWAFAHLLANGDLASVLLFGSLLGFAVYDRISVIGRASSGPLGKCQGRGAARYAGHRGGTGDLRAHAVLGPCQADRRAAAAMSGGRLVGIARRGQRRAPMQEVALALISLQAGLAGDCKGVKFPLRQITVLAREAWQAAAAEAGDPGLPWTVRRANLLVEGVELPKAKGGVLRVGAVQLEVMGQTYPCVRMEEARAGLLKALAAGWRGGVTCRVLSSGGQIEVGDAVEVLVRPREVAPRLPG